MPINKIATSSIELQYENYINILRAGQSVSDTGWSTYSNTAGVNPVTGTGGSPGITWSQNTSNPLSGNADLRFIKDAVNRQGNGVSIDFTVDNRHLAKVLQISFDAELIPNSTYLNVIPSPITGTYNIPGTTACTVTANHSFVAGQVVFLTFTSGTATSGYYVINSVTSTTFVVTVSSALTTSGNCTYTAISDLRVSIIQDPTGTPVVIEPVNTNIQLGIANQRIKHIATFQTHLSLKNYRLCIHVGNAGTTAFTVDFANFRVWEPTQSVGAVITDWVSYTPSSSISNATTSFKYKRSGSDIMINCSMYWTGTGITTFTPSQILPSGLSIDTSKLALSVTNTRASVGFGNHTDSGVSNYSVNYVYDSNNTIFPLPTGSPIPTPGSSDSTHIEFIMPILGWGSSVAMSSDSNEGRVVAARYNNATISSTVLNYQTLVYDTHNAYSAGVFTAPISGYYRGSMSLRPTLNLQISGQINESTIETIYDGYNSAYADTVSFQYYLLAGQRLRFTTSGNLNQQLANQAFTIERISAGSQIMAQTETVSVICRTVSNSITNVSTGISWTSKEVDSHGTFTSSNSTFTAPMSGIYSFNISLQGSSSATGIITLRNTTTSTDLRQSLNPPDSSSRLCFGLNTTIRLLAGESIQVQISATSNFSLTNNLFANYLSISRIGNY